MWYTYSMQHHNSSSGAGRVGESSLHRSVLFAMVCMAYVCVAAGKHCNVCGVLGAWPVPVILCV